MIWSLHKFKNKKILLILLSIFLIGSTGCLSMPPIKNPEKEAKETYFKDLKFKVFDKVYHGIATIERKPVYDIYLYPTDEISRIIIQTCNRERVIDKPKSKSWLKEEYKYTYIPVQGIEDNRSCPVQIATLDSNLGNLQFAYIEFEDSRPEISIEAFLRCNGEYSKVEGVGVCQSAAGLRQGLFFQERMIVKSSDPECDVMETEDGFFYEYTTPPHKCVYYFVASAIEPKTRKRLAYRHNSIGYTKISFKE